MQSHNNAVTSNYKEVNNSIKKKINMASKQILKGIEILNCIEINEENNCFFTLKDHKDNFANNPQVRLINPAKNELGRISKVILDKINLAIREHFRFNQWKNTQNVIDWFNEIPDNKFHKFVVFDIKEFYPWIKEQLKETLDFTNSCINVPENDKKIINMQENSCCLTGSKRGLRRRVDCLTYQWAHMTERKYVNLLVVSYFMHYH